MRYLFGILLLATWTSACADDANDSGAPARSPNLGESISITLRHVSGASGGDLLAETPNFRIRRIASDTDLRRFAESCERLVATTQKSWLGRGSFQPWVPKCDIVVHVQAADYVQCLGPGSEHTSGCATIRFDQGRVVARRLDFREDAADWRTDCLPHELTHLVLADRFGQSGIAPWASEGIAMLSESREKLDRRYFELRRVAAIRATFTARELMNVRQCPEPALRDAFYGESLSLVNLLLQWGSKEQLLDFVEASQSRGLDAAIRNGYPRHSAKDVEWGLRACLLTAGRPADPRPTKVAVLYRSQAAATAK